MTTNANEKKYFWKLLFSIAFPIALQHLLVNSLTFIDTLFMSQLGDVALSASGMATQWNWLLNMISFGICSGAAIFISQYWGSKDHEGIRKTYSVAFMSAFVISFVFSFFAMTFPTHIISVFNRDKGVIKAGSQYLSLVAFSYPATVLTSVQGTVLRSTEKVKLPMLVSGISVMANIFLDYALIFGKFGFPEMGIRGAALATAISAWFGYIVLLLVSFREQNVLIVPLKEFIIIKLSDFKSFMKRAFPVILNEFMWGLGTVSANAIFSNTGYENYAACTILRTVESLCMILFIGINDGGAVIIGKTIGEGNHNIAYKRAKRLIILTPILSAIIAVFAISFRDEVIYLFNMSGNITQTTVGIARILIVIYSLELIIRNMPYTLICSVFRAGGDTVTGAKYDLICLWLIAIPITFVIAFFTEVAFPLIFFISYIVEDLPKTTLCLMHFKTRKWIKPVQ